MTNKHSGSTFDSFLEEAGIKEDVETVAVKRVLAWQFKQAMAEKHKTKVDMAKELHTSRSQLERLLDPDKLSVTLGTISKAAQVLGKKVTLQITDAHEAVARFPSVSFRSVTRGEQVWCSRSYVLDHTEAWEDVSINSINRAVLGSLSSTHVISRQECQLREIDVDRSFLSNYEENSGLELSLSA